MEGLVALEATAVTLSPTAWVIAWAGRSFFRICSSTSATSIFRVLIVLGGDDASGEYELHCVGDREIGVQNFLGWHEHDEPGVGERRSWNVGHEQPIHTIRVRYPGEKT